MWLIWRADQRTDIFRQQMFSIRDELFDFALDGNIDFQHPAYYLLRNSMNGFIRYAHRLTFFQLLITVVRWKLTEDVQALTWHSKWVAAVDSLPEGTRDALRKFHDRSMDAVATHIILGSVALLSLLTIAVIHVIVKGTWTSLRSVFRDAAEKVVTQVFDPKVLEEEAARA
jgi:hypothetical protein